MADNRSNIDQQSSKINQKSIKNRPRGNQKSIKIRSKFDLGGVRGPLGRPKFDLGGVWGPFGSLCGSGGRFDLETMIRWTPLGPRVGGPKRSKIDPRAGPKAINLVNIFGIDFRALLGSILIRFGGPKWSQNWSRIGLESDHEANVKMLKNRWFLYGF